MSAPFIAVGKLPAAHLASLLAAVPCTDPRVMIGPRIGEDAAVIDLGDRCLVVATDPVTFATDRIGWYAVHVNANDVAVLGARPAWFVATVLLPAHGTTAELASTIVRDIADTCESLGATLCGGHTEITAGIDRPIVVGTMLGEVSRERLVRKERLAVGDLVLLTQGIAIEGTALLARERRADLEPVLGVQLVDRAARLLVDPGISVAAAALAAVEAGRVHAMHDPTEGGLAAGLVEMASAAGTGLHVFGDRIPILPETRAVCRALGLDPLRLIASGALLIGVPPDDARTVRDGLARLNIGSAIIAEVEPQVHGLVIEMDGTAHPLTAPERDEIARIFDRGT